MIDLAALQSDRDDWRQRAERSQQELAELRHKYTEQGTELTNWKMAFGKAQSERDRFEGALGEVAINCPTLHVAVAVAKRALNQGQKTEER